MIEKMINEKKIINGKKSRIEPELFPKVKALGISFVYLLLTLLLPLAFAAANKMDYLYNLNLCSIIFTCLALFWVLIRLSLFEKAFLFFRNRYAKTQHKSSIKVNKFSDKDKLNWTIEEYREYKKSKTWLGPLISFTMEILILIITIVVLETR